MTHAKHRWKRLALGCSLLVSFLFFLQNPASASNDFSHPKWLRLQSEISQVIEPKEPEPKEREPSVPEPKVPEPSVPEPSVPEPSVPEPSVPEPSVPEPSVPEPEVPEPGIPEGTSGQEQGLIHIRCSLWINFLTLKKRFGQ